MHATAALPRRGSAYRPRDAREWLAVPLGVAVALWVWAFLVPLGPLSAAVPAPGTVLLDSRGNVLDRDIRDGLRIPVSLEEVAPVVVAATVAAEDRRFWRHPGVDPLAVARAAAHLRSDPSGASTLTQQLARRAYLDGAGLPLPLRKAREALIAVQLEARYSKDEILEAYLNGAYYGRGAYGIEAAARVYFGVSAAHLDLAQASYLAGLPQAPATYGRSTGSALAQQRQAYVLDRLEATGAAPVAAVAAARATPLHIAPDPGPLARHYVAMVYDELERVLGRRSETDGLIIETVLDASLQREAERSVAQRLAGIADRRAGNAAVVALDPRDGRLLAVVGSADYGADAGQINMALALRQPGSALKPFLYLAALEHGYTAASMLLDVPATFETPSGPYSPVNYDLLFRGPVTLRVALASSLNVPAVRTLDAIGVEALLATAQRAGLSSLHAAEAYGLALTLGGGEVSLVDLASAYSALAHDGARYETWTIARVLDQTGSVLYEHTPGRARQVTTPEVAFILSDILADADARIPGFGPASLLDTPFGASVKTGTSSAFRDNWTVGYTDTRVVGVWVGNPDYSSMEQVSGITGAAPIWRDVMAAAVEGQPARDLRPPPGVARVGICAPTGLRPGPDCPSTGLEWFVAGTEPAGAEHYYVRQAGTLAINPPAEARAWARATGWVLAEDGGATTLPNPVVVLGPRDGARLYLAPELASRVLLRAAPAPGAISIDFYVDGAFVASAPADAPYVTWSMTLGEHVLRVTARFADRSASSTAAFEVRTP